MPKNLFPYLIIAAFGFVVFNDKIILLLIKPQKTPVNVQNPQTLIN
jgi:hypothetical protein